MSKSPDAFRTISEVAEWLGIPAHVLRFWESKFTQIKPVKRAGGRRYYRPADMMLLGGIKRLLHDEGKSIKEVQAMLRDQGIARVAERSASLDETADPMPVIESEGTVVDFSAPSSPASEQMNMDLGPQQVLGDTLPVGEPEVQAAELEPDVQKIIQDPESQPEPVAELQTEIEDVAAPAPAQTAMEPTELGTAVDEPVEPQAIRPLIVEVEDMADDALT